MTNAITVESAPRPRFSKMVEKVKRAAQAKAQVPAWAIGMIIALSAAVWSIGQLLNKSRTDAVKDVVSKDVVALTALIEAKAHEQDRKFDHLEYRINQLEQASHPAYLLKLDEKMNQWMQAMEQLQKDKP